MGAGRIRIHGAGRQEKQHKRAATSFHDKLAVIQHYEASHDMPVTIRHFYPELNETERRAKARVVYRWIQLKDSIAAHANSVKTMNQSRIRTIGSATTLGVDGEQELVAWVRDLCRTGQTVTSEMLRVRALEVAKARGVPDGAFVASGTWQKSFRERNRKRLSGDSDSDATDDDDAHGGATRKAATPTAPVQATGSSAESDSLLRPGAVSSVTEASAANAASTNFSSNSQDRVVTQSKASTTSATTTASPSSSARARRQSSSAAGRTPSVPIAKATKQPTKSVLATTKTTTATNAPIAATNAPIAATNAPLAATNAPIAATTAAIAPGTMDATEDRELQRRKADNEERKAELLNESIRCDNVLKRIRIAEENMLARKRLRDAGIPQDEIDAMLPIHRDE